jgi:hypothetical protein
MTRATPAVLVRLQLKWEAAEHGQPGLELAPDEPAYAGPDWRVLDQEQEDYLACAAPRCVLHRDQLQRAHAAGRAAALADMMRTMEAMEGPQ